MADQTKSDKESLKDILLKTLLSGKDSGSGGPKIDISTAKDILGNALNWAGKKQR